MEVHCVLFEIPTECLYVTAGFHRDVDENCAVLGYSAASSGNFLPTFRDNLSVPSSGVKNQFIGVLTLEDGAGRFSRNGVINYHYSLRNDPEERSSYLKLCIQYHVDWG